MPLGSYSDLQATVLDWLARPGDTLVSGAVPDMVLLFEEEARDRLNVLFSEGNATLVTVAGTATVPLPTYFQEVRELVVQGSPNRVLKYVTPEQLDTNWPNSAEVGQPVEFTISGMNFRFGPTPDAIYNIALDYMAGVPALVTSDGGTNWLLTNFPSLYLYGTLAEAEAYIGNDERIALWLQRRDARIERILLADRRKRWSGSALTMRSDTGNP